MTGTRLTDIFQLGFEQADVDFVVPDLLQDMRVGIDPFLLFKSRIDEYSRAHARILAVAAEGIRLFASGDEDGAAALLSFPEVNEVRLGYREVSRHGSGMGQQLTRLLLRTLAASPRFVERGIRHIEEMQLVSVGVGADRVSDMAANLLKGFLINYTQRQAVTYGIPLTKGVPIEHVFDPDTGGWVDGYFDLPANPLDPAHPGILLVPRRIVRRLPWINFTDYQRMSHALFLGPRRHGYRRPGAAPARDVPKADLVELTRMEVELIDRYVDVKERAFRDADPEILCPSVEVRSRCASLISQLEAVSPGQEHAYLYQRVMLQVLNALFAPDLIEGKEQVRTEHGTEIRDLVFLNDSDKTFWDYVRNEHHSLTVVFECKNKTSLESEDISQLAAYLGDAMGYLGVILTRETLSHPLFLKCLSVYNKGVPRRVILVLSDSDVLRMLRMRIAGNDPAELIRNTYRDLLAKVQ